MRTIQHPNLGQLTLLLIPALIFSILYLLLHNPHIWMIVVACIFLATYAIAASYFCIKQKCYKQLATVFIRVVLFAAYIGLIVYISH